ncbi:MULTISPECIES: IclR family transcriptional regulator [unclassified Ruegeria]|uniref:IclR family transcriptional regulator n=1 Tax=unclassified Ruegeria TaxID=2625375 RepID=UPI0014877930|nr:helix-turn-helix domain-containing protein [Ruegeria sp. HKCCD4332]NOD88028.1 helix-turn-helix domain-containing protein [Ruegeria sp. HKCCD4318]NOE14876.1 helix-turn-helix domain-containing protein [Ruegeria sp. HKCCD4318-2]NOG11521.1 IclR family transcriptional regulator [Ruegeria sp. HKCCD4315]
MQNHKKPRGRPKSIFKESSAGTVQSLDRALETLTTLAALERSTLSDLSRETGVPTATTHRILTTLSNRGYVSFDEQRQEWMVGIEAYRTGASYLNRNSVVEIGRPILRRLMRDTGETANMAMPDGSHVVFVSQVETGNPIRAFFPPGARTPMYASGTGKALLAEMSTNAVQALLSDVAYEAFTDRTHRSTISLLEDLTLVRQRGWSFDDEERYAGMSCTGAAILNQFGIPCAGISVSGPTARINKANVAYFGEMVLDAAREITIAIGGSPR